MLTIEQKQAQECAIKDIQSELTKQGRVFVQYITELNPVMEEIQNRYLREQENKSALHISAWTNIKKD